MKIQALGHACFAVTAQNGTKTVFDPFDESIGYPVPQTAADIVCVSHEHHDHNNVAAIPGAPMILRACVKAEKHGVKIYGVPSFHDEKEGALRGENTIFVLEADGLRMAHMGDIGHMLSKEQLVAIGPLDVVLIPVGGTFTVDADGAKKIVDALSPRIVVPMHYQTAQLTLGKKIGELSAFTDLFDNVRTLAGDTFEIAASDGQTGVVVPRIG